MCGRYHIADEEEISEIGDILNEINDRYKDTPEYASMCTGEVCPTDTVPILLPEGNKRRAALMKWGYPKWDRSGVIINARAETAIEKSMFRSGIESRRCLVPSTGFFEWRHEGEKAKKDKYLLRMKDDPMLYFAGIYNTFEDKDGQPHPGFVILTTAANESVQPIHNRMPVILSGSQKDLWLHDDQLASALLRDACNVPLERIAQGQLGFLQ